VQPAPLSILHAVLRGRAATATKGRTARPRSLTGCSSFLIMSASQRHLLRVVPDVQRTTGAWRQVVAQRGAVRPHGDADAGRRPHPSRIPAVHWSDNKQTFTGGTLLPPSPHAVWLTVLACCRLVFVFQRLTMPRRICATDKPSRGQLMRVSASPSHAAHVGCPLPLHPWLVVCRCISLASGHLVCASIKVFGFLSGWAGNVNKGAFEVRNKRSQRACATNVHNSNSRLWGGEGIGSSLAFSVQCLNFCVRRPPRRRSVQEFQGEEPATDESKLPAPQLELTHRSLFPLYLLVSADVTDDAPWTGGSV
jgi:hypothetical protein